MLKYLKEDWLGLLIYLALGFVMLSADLTIVTWQYWAILALMVAGNNWYRAYEFNKHMKACDQCPYRNKQRYEELLKGCNIMPPFSDSSAPEGTSPHDPKLPQP